MCSKYPPIVFFDLEGTLLKKHYALDNGKVAPSAWTLLAEHLGPECLTEEEITKDRWNSGGYAGYVEWMRDTIRIHQKHGLTRDLFDRVMQSVEFIEGVEPVFEDLRSSGVITAIVSGGFKALGDRAQRLLRVDHSICACEYFFGADGLVDHFNLLPSDVAGKIRFMQLIAAEHGIDPESCAFVGDGMNDVPLAKEVGISIAFNAQKELAAVATVSIDQERGAERFDVVAAELSRLHAARWAGKGLGL